MNCTKCGNIAVFSRKYSGERLCSDCFSNSILQKTAKTISKYKMIKSGDLVCAAVSGGKDSLSLLYILKKMSESHNFKLKAITIDEGIPDYREEALKIVSDFCTEINVEHKIFEFKKLFDLTLQDALDIRENEKTSSCSICGVFRRKAMDYAAKEIGADVIATGHNLDDTLQTFIINVLSGDYNRIGWMSPNVSSDKLSKIKPFSEIYENEIVFYAFTNGIPFQSEPCPHMSEGIRTELREFLNNLESNHNGIKNSMYGSISKISQIIKHSDYKEKRTCVSCGSESTGEICSACGLLLKLKAGRS